MKTYKNPHFTKRDFETTNVVFAQTDGQPPKGWVECDESEIAHLRCSQLYMQAGIRYFGYA